MRPRRQYAGAIWGILALWQIQELKQAAIVPGVETDGVQHQMGVERGATNLAGNQLLEVAPLTCCRQQCTQA